MIAFALSLGASEDAPRIGVAGDATVVSRVPLADEASVTARIGVAIDENARIGLSPGAEKKARIEKNATLFKSVVAGESDAATTWGELKDDERTLALASLAWSKDESSVREKAIKTLAKISPSSDNDGAGVKALASVAVAEGDGSMRALARKALTALDDKRAVQLLCKGLTVDDPLIQNNAAEAMRDIGGPRVFEIIIEHWKEIWGPSARGNIFIGQQRSYIADYDISGNSYDPVVKTFLTGVVLDAKVVEVEVDRWYYWIREVTGEKKLPNDPIAWQRWVKKNEADLARQAEKKKLDAIAAFKDE
ncbi:MAG TPA: HEAT repeat domain-containing protein [Planctomycetota bacterium]|nr:HEAT repeat domain-containing protein [Planctomycetota bacterium]